MSKVFRYYQEDADNAIHQELLTNNKCIVKMFCGTGKSLLMRKCITIENQNLVVFVFPSLSLIDQFYTDYLNDFPQENILKISSECESTTNSIEIIQFLAKTTNKIICITYHSYNTLLDNLGETHINVCIFDEAHHAVGETYQKLIFENTVCEKQIFFTATPKNANGIVMYDRENLDSGMCGKLVYDYAYLRGMNEDYLNPFEIRIDMYLENTNKSVYESIARSILASGNSRVLTFHSDVNTERETSVNNFVNDAEFKRVFKEVHKNEFPTNKIYKKIKMIALTADTSIKKRREILSHFDATPDNEVMVISSCETIGEGIDTKNANMCVFVDPKSSYVKIIQNIGRIVRKQFGKDNPRSTILIPCWVDKEKYIGCDGDREKCDEVIRQDMSATGNFNGILNVMSALKQEDEDIYDICLYYPDTFSPQEIENNLLKQGYQILDPIGDGYLAETMEYLFDDDFDYELYEDCETDEEILMSMAEDRDVCIEVHTRSLENPIERYNTECESDEIVRIYKSYDEENECDVWQPIVKKCGTKRNRGNVDGPRRDRRTSVNVHTNPDIKVLWKIVGDMDLTKDICSCVIDCEVVKYDPMEVAQGIVERAKERVEKRLMLLPRKCCGNKNKKYSVSELQENKDAGKLGKWKNALKGKGGKCSTEVRGYLDEKLKGWMDDLDEKAKEDAIKIVERANERFINGLILLPRFYGKENRNTPELKQECKDARKLQNWKTALKGQGTSNCSDEVRDYLDENIKGWRDELDKKAMEDAIGIVERANERGINGLQLLPRKCSKNKNEKYSVSELQDNKDINKLYTWRNALKGKGGKCSDELRDYLDENLKGWRDELDFDKNAMKDATKIVERANERFINGLILLPRFYGKENRNTPELEQENKDAGKLGHWKSSMKGQGSGKCSDEVRDYLDENLKGWRDELNFDKKAIDQATKIVERSKERVKNELRLLPRYIQKKNITTSELEQENKDACKICYWKKALKGHGLYKCSTEVRDYLDENLQGWRDNTDDTISMTSSVQNDVIEEEEFTIIPKKKSMKLKKPTTPKETPQQKQQRTKTEISVLHQRYKTLKSENLKTLFTDTPELWHKYHEISEQNEQSFPEDEIPRNRIIQELHKTKTKRTKLVVDLGCGKGQIAQYFQSDKRFNFINYDHISSNDTIISCDIANTPLEEDSVEICILSLAMWGSNCREYIEETHRILESGGKLYIIEPTKRWSEQDANGNIVEGQEGSKMKAILEEKGLKIVEQYIEKFCLFVCIKV